MTVPSARPAYYFSANVVTQTDEHDHLLAEVLVITLHQEDATIAGQIAIPLAGLPSLVEVLQRVLDKVPIPDQGTSSDRKVH